MSSLEAGTRLVVSYIRERFLLGILDDLNSKLKWNKRNLTRYSLSYSFLFAIGPPSFLSSRRFRMEVRIKFQKRLQHSSDLIRFSVEVSKRPVLSTERVPTSLSSSL